MSDAARKAVITTAQVQAALQAVNDNYRTIHPEWKNTEFDKGARGKGFAEYAQDGTVVRTFETKEDAYVHYSTFAEGMKAVMVYLPKPESEATADKPKTTRKPAQSNAA